MTTKERSICNHPDSYEPRIKCGYPLPCPYHTMVIDKDKISIPKHAHVSRKRIGRLRDIAEAINKKEGDHG